MKKILIFTGILTLASCSTTTEGSSVSNPIVNDVISDISKLENYSGNPIDTFALMAVGVAEEKILLTKDNASEVFEKAPNYATAIVVTGNHTIVKLDMTKECKSSGAWGTCMPYGSGYVKRGDLEPMEDHINNIIGTPDDQERTVYFFN